jgi:hypothetical protein
MAEDPNDEWGSVAGEADSPPAVDIEAMLAALDEQMKGMEPVDLKRLGMGKGIGFGALSGKKSAEDLRFIIHDHVAAEAAGPIQLFMFKAASGQLGMARALRQSAVAPAMGPSAIPVMEKKKGKQRFEKRRGEIGDEEFDPIAIHNAEVANRQLIMTEKQVRCSIKQPPS